MALGALLFRNVQGSSRLEILNLTGTGPDWSEFGRNRTGFHHLKKLTGSGRSGRIETDGRIFNRIVDSIAVMCTVQAAVQYLI